MSHFISIGCEGGGPETRHVCELKVPLFHALQRHVTATHSQQVDAYDLVLRVDGTIQQYGEPGLARIRFVKSRRYVSADIRIPRPVWEPLSVNELRAYIADQVEAAVSACVARLQREGPVNDQALLSEVRAAIGEYLEQTHGAA